MIKFIKTHDEKNKFDTTDVEIKLPLGEITLTETIEAFEEFLKACGYVYDGHLDFIEDEDKSVDDPDLTPSENRE